MRIGRVGMFVETNWRQWGIGAGVGINNPREVVVGLGPWTLCAYWFRRGR